MVGRLVGRQIPADVVGRSGGCRSLVLRWLLLLLWVIVAVAAVGAAVRVGSGAITLLMVGMWVVGC